MPFIPVGRFNQWHELLLFSRGFRILDGRVSLVRSILSVIVAVFWVAASSHVLLETAGLIHQEDHHGHALADHEQDGADNHDAADGRCVLGSKAISAPAPVLVVLFQAGEFSLSEYFCDRLDLEASGLAPPSENWVLVSSWQFSRRTALPPRAPSLLS